jgi:hypothetical protein
MHNPFDQLAKKVGKEALDASGPTVVQYEVHRDAQHADIRHDPDPARDAERARLGLLGRLAATLCLIEIYGHAPSGAEIRACLGKHFAHWNECERKARVQNRRRKEKNLPPVPFVEPRLWIIAATASAPMLRKLQVKTEPGWPLGIYFHGDDLYRVGIVVADELPRERTTLLVRIMAAGAGLPAAIADLAALPEGAHERAVALEILLHLQNVIAKKPGRTPEEEEFIVSMHDTWAEARKQARDEGRDEGRAEEAARAVLTALRVRGLPVPDAVRERILAERDPARLERWLERAILATSAADVLDAPH